MFKKTMKKMVCGVLAISSVVACAGTMTACETSHPKVEVQIEFNDKTYTLDYELYRKIAPSTVSHFLWLADNGYYDGLCVHNFETGTYQRMYTGGYTVNAENEVEYKNYYDVIKGYANYAQFPTSVWMDEAKENPLYTLRGEFTNAKFSVDKGALKETFGSLTMYYHEKDTKDKVYVPYAKSEKEGEMARREYKYNSATSLFYISLYQGSMSNAGYCTFATLDEDSVEVLESFQEDLNEYVQDEYATSDADAKLSDFTSSQYVYVDSDDQVLGDKEKKVTFNVPNAPIIIKKVAVKKY